MKIKYEFADGDVEVDVPNEGIMIRRKDAGTIRLMRVCMKELFMRRRTKILRQFLKQTVSSED